jgi:hypothetical protein
MLNNNDNISLSCRVQLGEKKEKLIHLVISNAFKIEKDGNIIN